MIHYHRVPYILAALLGCLIAARAHICHAANLEIGAAKSQFSNAGDVIWFDQAYPHTNSLHPWGGILGASGDVNNWFGWRVWAIDFGHTTNSAVWEDDASYFAGIHNPASVRGEGSGDAYGVSFAPTFSYRPTQETQLSVEGGALVYSARWREQYQSIAGGPWSYQSQGWHTDWTPYFGLTARYGKLFASYRKYRDVYAVDSVFGNSLKQYVLGISLPF